MYMYIELYNLTYLKTSEYIKCVLTPLLELEPDADPELDPPPHPSQ